MPRTPTYLPPGAARAFVDDMHAFHAEPNAIQRNEIAARQLRALREHRAGKMRLLRVKEMFEQMKNHA
jgi:hypothetical protein